LICNNLFSIFLNQYKKFTYAINQKITKKLEHELRTYEEAMVIAKIIDKLLLGVLYRTQKPSFHSNLHGNFNPIKNKIDNQKIIKVIRELIQPK